MRLDFGLSRSNLSAEMQKAWPYEFSLQYSVTLSSGGSGKEEGGEGGGLRTMLGVTNQGDKPFEFQMLTHTYFAVDVSRFLFFFSLPPLLFGAYS